MKKIAAFVLSCSAVALLTVGIVGCGNTPTKTEVKKTETKMETKTPMGETTTKKVEEKKTETKTEEKK